MGDVGSADEREAEAIGSRGGLFLRLAAQAEWLGIQRRIAAVPENGAMRLTRIEAAEIAETATAAAPAAKSSAEPTETASLESTGTSTKPTCAHREESCTGSTAVHDHHACTARLAWLSARSLLIPELRAERLHRIAQPVHIDAGQWTHSTRLPTNRHGLRGEV